MRVGVDVEERLAAELGQRLDHAAAGVEQLGALVGDHDLRPRARGEMPFDLVGEVMHVDHGALDAGLGQPVEHVVDQRLAGDLHQRLRHRVGDRPHALAEAGGEHHGAAGSMLALSPSLLAQPSSFGTLTLYQALSGASDGMRQRALQIGPYPRDVTQILRLAVAPVEPREDAEDLGGALRRQRGVGLDEDRRLEIRVGLAPRAARSGRAA